VKNFMLGCLLRGPLDRCVCGACEVTGELPAKTFWLVATLSNLISFLPLPIHLCMRVESLLQCGLDFKVAAASGGANRLCSFTCTARTTRQKIPPAPPSNTSIKKRQAKYKHK
jgi:hypothetical protein